MTLITPIHGRISQRFGRPALKVEPTMYLAPDESRCRPTAFPGAVRYEDVHPGTDVICPVGTPVLAPADGKLVAVIEYRIWNPFKNRYVTGLQGRFRYEWTTKVKRVLVVDHLDHILREGVTVKAGQPWAWTGDSGIVTGPHAHVEIRQGGPHDLVSTSNAWFRENSERVFRY